MTKTEAAFRFSGQRLFEQCPRIYLWTFTFKEVHSDWVYARAFAEFFKRLQNIYGGTLAGLKVLEFHSTHGCHFHALLNTRVGVGEVRRIAKRFGIGRIHVVDADPDSVGYLAKYLSKQWKADHLCYSRGSRWGSLGAFEACRVRDVAIDNPVLDRKVRLAQSVLGRKQLPYKLVDAFMAHPFMDEVQVRLLTLRLAGTRAKDREVTTDDADRHLRALYR